MKRKIDEAIIQSLRNLRSALSPKLFKNNIKLQLSQYELTPEFLEEFDECLTAEDICKYSLSPECIYYLISKNKFNYGVWSEKLDNKNLDILVDDDFVSEYNVDVGSILSKTKTVSPVIYKKYVESLNSDVRRNMLLQYNGPEISVTTVLDNLDILQMDIFKIDKIIQEIKSYNSEIQDKILHSKQPINPLILLYLMQMIYIPNEVLENIDDLTFTDVDLSENNPQAERLINESQNILSSIVEKYPVKVVSKLLEIIYFYAKEILLNGDLLKKILIECDNLDEDILVSMYSIFLITNTRTELLNYAKNFNYFNLAAVLTL